MNRFSETERIGVNEVERIFLNEFKWIPRKIFESDVGLDMEVEICENRKPLGQLFGIQIKTGESYFKENVTGDVVYRGNNIHLEYWLSHCLPILIVLHNPVSGVTLWETVTADKISRTKNGWKIEIPVSQQLNINFKTKIQDLNKFPLYFQRLQRLAAHKKMLSDIMKGKVIAVEIEEWVNKSIGRATVKVVKVTSDNNDIIISESNYINFYGIESLQKLFPWADFTIDEDYYEDSDYDDFMDNHGIWDDEEKAYCGSSIDFADYKENLPDLRYIVDGSGEIQSCRLIVSINDLGKSFIEVNKYLEFDWQLKLPI